MGYFEEGSGLALEIIKSCGGFRTVSTLEVENEVRTYLIDHFLSGRAEALPTDGSLLGSVIDSTGLLELVTYLQERFGITVEDEDVVPENFGSVQQVAGYVEGKLRAKR
jgi:acyl carrier protein